MAITTETIRKLTIQGSAQGVAEATDAINKLATSTNNLAVVTDTTSKRQLSAEAAYRKQTLSLVDGARQQEALAKATKTADTALAQGIITQDEHAKRVRLINQKYGEASLGAKAFAAATQGVSGQLIALSAGAGPVGTFLAALGPWGLAAAVVLGTLEKAISSVSAGAHDLAQNAQQLREFSEITGLTTSEVQALRSEAGKFGLTSDEAQTAIQNFTARFNELRLGSGALYTQLSRIDPALRDQMQATTDAGTALTLFGQALLKVDDIFQRNALVKAASGRGGLRAAELFTGINVDEVNAKFIAAGKGLDDNIIKKLPLIAIETEKTSKQATAIMETMWAGPTLAFEKYLADTRLGWAKWARDFQKGAQDLGQNLWTWLTGRPPTPGGPGARFPAPQVPIGVGPGEAGGTLPAPPTALTPEAQVEKQKALIAVLGVAATEAEKLRLKQDELSLSAKNAGVSTDVLTRAQSGLNEEYARNRGAAILGALGSAATLTERYDQKTRDLNHTLEINNATQEESNRARAALASDKALDFQRANVSALGDAATAAEKYSLQVNELKRQLDQGNISQDTFNRALLNLNPTVKQLKDSFEQLAQSIVSGFIDGKNAADALHDSLTAVAKTAASSAITNLIKGDFASAAVSALIAGGAYVASKFTGQKTESPAVQGQYAAYLAQATTQQQVYLAYSQVQQTQENYQAAFEALTRINQKTADDAKASAAVQTQAEQDALDAARQQQQLQDQALARQRSFDDRYYSAIAGTGLIDQLAAFDRKAQEERIAEAAAGNGALVQLERALAAERANIEKAYNDAVAKRQQSFQDRLFAATNDTSTLAGQLAAFDRQAQQQRLDEQKAGGEAIADLEAALGAERLKIINDYNKQIVAAQTTAMKQILDYVEKLKLGELSVLSPQAKLAAAQEQYNKQLGLARAGDAEALASITQTADALLSTAKSFYASSKGYADIYSQVTGDLTTLAGGRTGGVVPRYGMGGMVGGGQYNIDSLMAHYATGGNIMLAGGEFVTKATSVNAQTLPILQSINATGAANDNNFADLGSTFISVGNAIIARLERIEGAYRDSGKAAQDAARIAANRTQRPGKISAAA